MARRWRLWSSPELVGATGTVMLKLKDTERSLVSLTFDGCVVKQYRGHLMRQRMENEVRVLEHLKRVCCPFVPRLVSCDRQAVQIVVTACGVSATHVSPPNSISSFKSCASMASSMKMQSYANITYDARAGQLLRD